ncbi:MULTISPECIES: bifunctional ADP-dependent NAD(P)H-hydrate dehydratase/NAD(P)H-hydrate epimerase [Syntrophotalea]|jgi:NAD(P)H-hydrate epimerase|uniref:Bifunctional NAD(P)H-hydrate repair enzyme n=1 Tax=Syntrophotalea acetylenica TaxID=29542 RepID=A0A1L3GGT9_SYNAC|nr:bifunctional ADP-dependent NAD(P)H-hydrate dehydratase/NAD(P)H-hydrate epimerase [Syntrophotalea acetylenica]APG25153.1 bifunctional ADP-dependent (S)-NAD(P)H-hydrate dehydratase/NAD(P)H-hydrate epimerase [Syntrophotalea acetylenica]APG43222.1 bifunctional ADP-dependent (S)-NAD(P)H-hydrate dehydratase/NAD(P)H-hydrate epimerase [Syntrophotalea acetylenica]MDY0261423.1 bifunctional ADP-dependent NAD(P)H-hydrate dehydratase/NAD(P)H-hydrate epimerase [Syntrophotalea acetylenica]
MKVSTVAQMRAMDRAAIDCYGIAEELLMENAGQAAFSVLAQIGPVADQRFVVFCGLGNNGGDGFVVARKIHSAGGTVKVLILGDPDRLAGAARLNLEIIRRLPLEVRQLENSAGLAAELAACAAVIDGIFGTGLTREVGGLHRAVIEAINACGKPVLSIDIPSGVEGDTGQALGCAVRADHTVTFGLPKIGNLLYPGFALGGCLHVSHISFPPALYRDAALKIALNVPPPLPPRDHTGHKGSFGQALFIAGAAGYLGAPCFAALSYLKAGGGYSRLAAPQAITPFIAMKASEVVFLPQVSTAEGSLALCNRDALLALANSLDMTVLGPGLSLQTQTQQLARELIAAIERPLLIDGDGITAICQNPEQLRQRRAPTVLTPHPGEMSRLTGIGIPDLEKDRIRTVQRAAGELGAIIVLKGAHSLIGFPDGRVFINPSGNSGMASAGSGDVLTGTIAAMHGLGLSIEDAVCKGVFLHGAAGDLAAMQLGEDGMTAQDILDHLPQSLKQEREGWPASLAQRYAGPHIVA